MDEVLGNQERKKSWIDREKERLERIEREERRREMRERRPDENTEVRTEDVTVDQTDSKDNRVQ